MIRLRIQCCCRGADQLINIVYIIDTGHATAAVSQIRPTSFFFFLSLSLFFFLVYFSIHIFFCDRGILGAVLWIDSDKFFFSPATSIRCFAMTPAVL